MEGKKLSLGRILSLPSLRSAFLPVVAYGRTRLLFGSLLSVLMVSCGVDEDGKRRVVVKKEDRCVAIRMLPEEYARMRGRYGGSLHFFDHEVDLEDGTMIETKFSIHESIPMAPDEISWGRNYDRLCQSAETVHDLGVLVKTRNGEAVGCLYGPSGRTYRPVEKHDQLSFIHCPRVVPPLSLCTLRMGWESVSINVKFDLVYLEYWESILESVTQKFDADAEDLGKC